MRAVHAHQVEDAGVADQRLEPVGMAADPVDHEAAVRSPRGRDLGLVEERVFLEGEVEALHQVFVDLAGPVLADLVGELLAVAGRAAGVDRDHGIARSGEHLIIPPPVPFVVPGALRAAVDQEDDGIGLLGVEPGRPEQKPWTWS